MRCLAALLAIVLIFSGCEKAVYPEEDRIEEGPVDETLPIIQETEEKRPLIFACGRNLGKEHPAKWSDSDYNLLPLLFDSLVELDNSYRPVGGLAQEIQQEGLVYTITLRDAVFSDDSVIGAADVVDSLKAAMENGSAWKKQLSIIVDYGVLAENMIRITVSEPRQDFINLLTFPVVKVLNGDNFLGSGQYMLDEDQGLLLVKNPNYSGEADGPECIELIELPNQDTLRESLKIGIISCLFDDLSDGEAMNLSERNQPVEIGNIVFLGINNRQGLCSQVNVRKAIGAVLDRQVLVDRVYASKATAAELPFHPNYYRTEDCPVTKLGLDEAQKLLKGAGLVKSSSGYYGTEEQSSLKLLYHSENIYRQQTAEILKQQLDNLGLQLELIGMSYEEYMTALEAGEFDLYLGELAIDDSMDIRRLLQPGNGYGYGCEANNSVLSVYNSYQQGNISMELFLDVYQSSLPVIPLLYRQGLIISDRRVQESFSSQPDRAFEEISLPQ